MSRIRLVAVLVGFLLLLPTTRLRADEAEDGARAFDRAIERIHADCKKEKFKAAERKLASLLKKHREQPYARARRADLEDLAERIAFGRSHDAPSVEHVVSGRVRKWDCEKGYLHVHYTPSTDQDLEREKGGWLRFPGVVTGPCLVEVVGRSYPDRPNDAPRMLLGGGICPRSKKRQSWIVSFGTPPREVGDRIEWMPARILHANGTSEKEMVKLDKVPIKAGTRFRLQMKVTKTHIAVGINGKTLFNRRRSPATYGMVGFDVGGWDKMTFAGTIEPAWVQDRMDKLAQAKLLAFRKSYEKTRHLPAWVFEGPDPVASAPPPTRRDLPAEVDRKLKGPLARTKSRIAARDWHGARRALEELEAGGAPRSVTSYFEGRILVETGELKTALASLDRCLKEAPEFLDALLLKARTLRRLGQTDAAYRVFKLAIQHHKREPRAYEEAAIGMLAAARPGSAKEVTELAVKDGVASSDLDRVARLVVKALRGPTWNQTFEYRSRNYHVLSNISKDTCIEAAKILEEALVSYRVNLDWVTRDKTRLYPVYLFSGEQGFQEYMSEFSAIVGTVPDQVAGLYSPLLKQLVVRHLPSRDEMLEVIRHEGFHQYLDRLMPDAPIWFNEGLAVYHQNAVKKQGRLHFGSPHPAFLKVLGEKGLVPLKDFLLWSRKEFYAASPASYAQAWALLHLLKEGKPKHRALLKALIEDFQNEPPLEVIRKHFPPASLAQLKTELQVHIGRLRKR